MVFFQFAMLNYQRVNIQRWKETKHMRLRVSSEKLEATEGPGISEKHASELRVLYGTLSRSQL